VGASAETGESDQTSEPVYDEIAGTFVAEGWSGIEVCAISVENQNAKWCSTTKGVGEYSITNLPPGEYVVYFPAPGGELKSQYYRQAWTRAEAQPIVVKLGFATRGVNEVMKGWPEPPLPVHAVEVPTPENHVNPYINPPYTPAVRPPAPILPPEPELILRVAKSLSLRALSSFSALCRYAACDGAIKLVTHVTGKGRRNQTVVLGWASFSLAKEVPAVVALHLDAVGRADLARGRRQPVSASVTVSIDGAPVEVRSVHLK